MTRRRPPKQIKVLGQRIVMDASNAHLFGEVEGRTGEHNLLGYYEQDAGDIKIAQHQGRDVMRDTYLHETLHAIFAAMGIKDSLDDCKDPRGRCDHEKIVARLSAGLLAVLRDNPTLVAYLTDRSPL